ncbi:MAG: DUF262 domain-containing protein [Prevotella sp.]|nr:DUF262 domain-containing protein [Prevotella sp.]
MDSNIKSNTSFWSEISDYKIQVPYYQRDYAQGRIDNGRIDNIRKVFVEEMYGAIMGFNNKECHLGLVFGSYDENEKVFIAVDGQQRLTTVFLLHWYVAWRENKLNDYKEKLLNFSWDTRSYSSQFVELLFKIRPSGNVIDSIKTNSNYFSVWENDPTVKGMLTMLEEIEKQYPNDILLCSQLFSNDCKIKYDILKLEKDSDGKTYLKMNSRGRSLTTFELFKSKLLDKYKPNFGHKFDNEWLSFMIKISATSDSQFSDPDIPFMNIINEYTYTYLQLKLKSGSDIANNYKEFTDAKVKGELTDVPFISFDKYNGAFEGDCLEYFEKSLDWICQNYEDIKLIDNKIRFSDSRFFIDAIIKDNNPNFTHRAKLFAVFKYAELTGYDQIDTELYEKWTRVFRNLVANTDIDGSNIGGICKAINKIDNSDIYGYLSNGGEISAFTKDQVAEEIAKAKQILYGAPRSDGKSWEEIIIEAENYAFFKGAIRFLFTDGEGNINWCDFNTKWTNAKEYFDENGVKKKTSYRDEALLMKSLLANCDDFEHKIKNHFEFSNDYVRWRRILIADHWRRAVDTIMSKEVTTETTKDYVNNTKDVFIKNIIDDGLMDYVCNNMSGAWIRSTYHGYHAIWISGYPASQVVLNPILSKLQFEGKISYRNSEGRDSTIPNCRYYKCFDKNVDFKYKFNDKYYYFNWWGNPNETELDVYLTEDNWNDYKKRPNPTSDKGTDEDIYYCFRVTKDMESDPSKFTHALDELIKKLQIS